MSPHPQHHRPRRSPTWRIASALAGVAAMVTAMAVLIAPAASASSTESPLNSSSTPYDQSHGIPICHATNSDSNPYVSESPDFDSIVKKSGHDGHTGQIWNATLKKNKINWGDIIPAFYYTKNGVDGYYAGKNWDAAGKAIWDSSCTSAGTPATGPELTLIKTASPSEFSAAGQKITYTFTVINSGDIEIKSLKIVDNWTSSGGSGSISAVTCPTDNLAKGASTVCTATYKTTATDVANGKDLVNTAFATAKLKTGPDGVKSNEDTATVTYTSVAQVVVNKVWSIGGKTYRVPGDTLPDGYSASLILGTVSAPSWGTTYGGFATGDTIAINETPTVPTGCANSATGTGPQVLAAGLNTFTVTNTVTCDVSVTLSKSWVKPAADSADAVDLTIGGADDARAGVSHATTSNEDAPATATSAQGATITLAEAFTGESHGTYETTLQCSVNGGNPISVGASELSGTFAIPADARSVDCMFVNTNTDDSSVVTLRKAWEGTADEGDTVRLRVSNTTTNAVNTSGTATVGSESGTSSVTVFPGDSFTVGEDAVGSTDLSHYGTTYSCGYGEGNSLQPNEKGVFTVPNEFPAGSTIRCTITNTHKTMLTVTKEWHIDGVTYTVPQGTGPALPAGYGATLTVGGTETAWGTAFPIDGEGIPAIAEKDVRQPANCSVAQTLPNLDQLASGADNEVRVVNTVSCETTTGGGGGTPSGDDTPAPPETPEVLPQDNAVAPPPPAEVLGVAQEEPPAPIQVLGASHGAPAPSANAHTGQDTSLWVYVLLAAGLVMMLGAAGIRRHDRT